MNIKDILLALDPNACKCGACEKTFNLLENNKWNERLNTGAVHWTKKPLCIFCAGSHWYLYTKIIAQNIPIKDLRPIYYNKYIFTYNIKNYSGFEFKENKRNKK